MTTTARAIVFPKPFEVELRDIKLPVQGEWDLTVELEASAISIGTERWALTGKRPEGDVTFPCIPGYLSVGKIVDAGSSARTRFAIGERVNFVVASLPEGYGGNWMCGHLTPAIVNVDPAKLSVYAGNPYVEKVPAGLSGEEAALAGLSAVACRGIDMAGIGAHQTINNPKIVVLGQGVIGHAAAQICRLRGACVIAADVMPARIALSRQYATDTVVNSKEENLLERVMEFTNGKGADIVIDTTGSMAVVAQIPDMLALFGTIVFQGWYPPPNTMNFHNLQLKFARTVYPCCHSGDAVSRCMTWMQTGKLNLKPLITHRFNPGQAREAYDLILNRPEETMGIVFDWTKERAQ
ncbi:MAG: zinc-binding dehydrogenase [Opitutaceae bacterium]|jgi:2-desacetyl-2-hydroxyethyl bacteriochlorophyllide A dehydrogenase|nr:zinc-binding dehydrogenase [Opitutaceae bacterium]